MSLLFNPLERIHNFLGECVRHSFEEGHSQSSVPSYIELSLLLPLLPAGPLNAAVDFIPRIKTNLRIGEFSAW